MPTPCGLGLKFTVGTAVSVSPLGLLGGQVAAQERRPRDNQERRRRRRKEGRGL